MDKGYVFKFGNDVDTDQIISSQYIILPSIEEMAPFAFECLDTDFAKKVRAGDVVVGGENFGCGSSREQAPSVLKSLGVKAIVAKSVARIFFRNAINIGLPVLLCKEIYGNVKTGQEIAVELENGTLTTEGKTYPCTKLPKHMQGILQAGGLIESLNAQEVG